MVDCLDPGEGAAVGGPAVYEVLDGGGGASPGHRPEGPKSQADSTG